MRYLCTTDLETLGVSWPKAIDAIGDAVASLSAGDYVQPIKPYLRFRNLTNRIIAMPAFVGGKVDVAGIKWIASFPGNLDLGVPRAHSVLILNEASTGVPRCIINSGELSAIRTAAVSGFVLDRYARVRGDDALKVGMTGFGPIGRMHLRMLAAVLGTRAVDVAIHDPRATAPLDVPEALRGRVRLVGSWQEAYDDADVFLTCTVSKDRYIDRAPKPGSLQLNVSLRDYHPDVVRGIGLQIVDDWDEVCRENSDVEACHKAWGMARKDTVALGAFAHGNPFETALGETAMFHPMGMAIFDMAIATHYERLAAEYGVGTMLRD